MAEGHRKNHLPLDSIYLDIDYMERYKDFTIDRERFPDFEGLVEDMKAQNIRLVPIIDAGVKVEKGYPVYEEGVEKGYFCKDKDGKEFIAGVWPGQVHFPDVLNKNAREWLETNISSYWKRE